MIPSPQNKKQTKKNISLRGAEKRHPFNKTLSTNIVHKLQCIIITFLFPRLILEPDYKVRKNTETRYNVLKNPHKGR